LSRGDTDAKAEEAALHFDPQAFTRLTSPVYEVVAGLKDKYHIPFFFDQDLGYSAKGKKILGRFDFTPRRILIDQVLPYDSPRFRWTLCHEMIADNFEASLLVWRNPTELFRQTRPLGLPPL
jgi:hypothetical protein